MNKVLVIAAHPDDEILGCGGTMMKHIKNGDLVEVLILATGLESRSENAKSITSLRDDSIKANEVLGVKNVNFLDFPDNKMDTIALLDIVQKIEIKLNEYSPNIIYTHSPTDLNIDHQITSKAVVTATRPKPNQTVKELYFFEVQSSSEWNFTDENYGFSPNVFIDISEFKMSKTKALEFYTSEMLIWPNARSTQAVEKLAEHRGSTIGVDAAEAFRVARIIK